MDMRSRSGDIFTGQFSATERSDRIGRDRDHVKKGAWAEPRLTGLKTVWGQPAGANGTLHLEPGT